MYKKKKNFWAKHWDAILLDIFASEIALFLAVYFKLGAVLLLDKFSGRIYYERMVWILIVINLLVVSIKNPYTGIMSRGHGKELGVVLIQSLWNLFGMLIFMFSFKYSSTISRAIIGNWFIAMVILIYLDRLLLKRLIAIHKVDDNGKSSMLIIADMETVEHAVSQLLASPFASYKVVGVAVIDKDLTGQTIQGVPVIGNCDSVFEYIRTKVVDEVFIDGKNKYSEEMLAERLTELGVTVHISLIHTNHLMSNRMIEYYGDYVAMTTSMHIATSYQAFVKRLTDIIGALVGLVLCAIAFIFVAPVIMIQAPGPIFFSQTRIGKNGRRFKFYKFRSMYVDAEERKKELMSQNQMQGLMFKMDNDPRIFPAGHFIRKYSIDELPQFWNVLIGDMSLVGTRPPTENEFEQYELQHKARLASRPGLTGLWQVSGRSNITDFDDVVALDTEYIKNWSIFLDLKIIIKTFVVVIKGSGSK